MSVTVCDERLSDSLAFEVDPADALLAFHHPYAYAAKLRVRDPPDRQPFTEETS